MSASPAIQMGLFGQDDPAPFVSIDGVDYPLVPGSIVEGAPLNPFSPSNTDGNSVAVVSQRHASEVWDDFTGGLGYRDDEPGNHQYALGNLDARVPGALTLPQLASGVSSGAAAALPYAVTAPSNFHRVHVENVGDMTTWGFLTWRFGWDLSGTGVTGLVRRITSGGVATVGIPDTSYVWGVAQWNGNWYAMTTTPAGDAVTYKGTGGPTTLTFAVVNTVVGGKLSCLVNYDNKLICLDQLTNTFKQFDATSNTWVSYIGGFVPLTGGVQGDGPIQLFVWTGKSGSQDALYLLTWYRILVYDEEGQQWEPLYATGDLFGSYDMQAHVSRRDNTLLVTTSPSLVTGAPVLLPTGTLLAFTPGTVDNLPINKGYAYPNNAAYNALGNMAPVNHIVGLSSGVHWNYAWCYAPTDLGSGVQGGVFAYNEFGGWTQIFDPVVANGGVTTKSVIGGGYAIGRLLTILTDGSYFVQQEVDAHIDLPFGTYDSQAAGNSHDYFLRSGRVFNKQRNIKKLGSHIEVTFRQPVPASGFASPTAPVYLRWRYFNENGLSNWVSSGLFNTGAQRVSASLSDGSGSNGISYYYMEWELHMYMPTNTAVPPVVESVVLYYTYHQTNKYAYSLNIDLTAETWDEFYPDGTFHGKSRAYLQTAILAAADRAGYHSFAYAQLSFTETVARADMSLARRESADDASGVYGVTVRDLELDPPTGIFYSV